MDFFRPTSKGNNDKNAKLTGANIQKSTEDRLKNLKEKRKERREKINEQSSYFKKEENSLLKETEALRKNKNLSRKDYRKQERKDLARLGLRNEPKKE